MSLIEPVEIPVSPLTKRLGRFRISRALLMRTPEAIQPLFAKIIVVEAVMRWESDSVEYVAMSELFELLDAGVMAPAYAITFRTDDKGNVNGFTVTNIPYP